MQRVSRRKTEPVQGRGEQHDAGLRLAGARQHQRVPRDTVAEITRGVTIPGKPDAQGYGSRGSRASIAGSTRAFEPMTLSPLNARPAKGPRQWTGDYMLKEFKEFAVRGNVVDMAVGIIIGAAFGKIVDSLVKDVIMPPIGLLLGKVDFANLFLVLREGAQAGPYLTVEAAQKAGAVTFNYGMFINTLISFVIVAFAVFMLIRALLRLKLQEEKKPAAAPEEIALLREIRDTLKR
jgi:large conductance mechanosensitive channel